MIIKSKMNIPTPLKQHVPREHLFANSPNRKLGIICAPAGYGKTTALAQWANLQSNVAWFSIDCFDNSCHIFYNYFIQTIAQLDDFSCPATLEFAKQKNDLDVINLFTLLFNEVADNNAPLNIILDNFQHITDIEICQGLNFFIKHMPAHWHIILSSRTAPNISVSSLRIKNQLLEINQQQLAFTEKEALLFFTLNNDFQINSSQLSTLYHAVDGWPTALQLVSLLSKDPQSFKNCAEQIGNSNHIYLWDYLDEEVFSTLSAELQAVLLQIAVLNKLNADIINALCGINNGQDLLMQLQAHGTFITSVDNQYDEFVFHTFFSAFLQHKSKQCQSPQADEKQIAQLWLNHHDLGQALPHVIKCEDEDLVIQLLKRSGWELFNDGQLGSLETCFNLIKHVFWGHPHLVILRVWLLQSQHQSYRIAPLIKQAEKKFEELSIVIEEDLLCEFSAIKAQIAINKGQTQDALTLAKKTLQGLSKGNSRTNIVAQLIIAEAYHCLGKLDLAYQSFQEVKQLAIEHNMHQNLIWASYQQAEILHSQSFPQRADQQIEEVISLIKEHHLQAMPLYAFPLHFKIQRAYQEGRFELANRLCEEAIEIVSVYGEQWQLYTYALQAKIALEEKDLQRGDVLIEEIERLLRNQNYHSDWISAANYARIKYWRIQGDINAIERWLNSAPHPKTAFNHFDQCHIRNLIRAHIKLGNFEQAKCLVEKNILHAEQCQLQIEINRNLILLTSIESKLKHNNDAKLHLSQALESSLFTGLNTSFVREAANLKPVLQELSKDSSTIHSVKNKLMALLSISGIDANAPPINPFDNAAVIKIKNDIRSPRLVKNIPLTPREWQVLGLIHSGCKNQQIADTMGVAPTTVKSHIRNVYQKLGLEGRREALSLTDQLVELI